MKKSYKNIIRSILLMCIFVACDDVLETEPNDRISNERAVSDFESAEATLLGAYDRFRRVNYYQRDFIVIADGLADNIKQTINNTSRLNGVSQNQPYTHFSFWQNAYEVINSANFVIAGVDDLQDATESQEKQLKGEALFLRALAHFDLVRAYARNPNHLVGDPMGIPIITDPNDIFGLPARNSIDEVYHQVIADLNNAFNLINSNEVTPNRASKVAVQALLSRVYLYQKDWGNSIEAANYVIQNVDFDIETDGYTLIFSEASETIFGLSYSALENPGLNNSLQGLFYIDNETGIGYGDFVVRDKLYNLHETDDLRLSLYIPTTKSGENVNFIGKYLGYQGAFGLDNIPIIRLSEILLNRAEALAENNDLSAALSDLNKIRNRVGLSNILIGSKEEVINNILEERRIELAFEGHRIFDLKRRGLDIPKGMLEIDCQQECNISYEDFRVIANIPVSETDVNKNLIQNPGY
ncbi:RagB/SusD family nutrient uptake outer membrane protein [Aquimarina aquimarini]|uniref:RagB/SusD family nutrient uptake outer membrane protein n=1 Tax=Aquimarina aquimarini TaxID=1191734 RepID=UPI000D552C27|nr:RagB/SusD family nutrient uptake outer membrane protein [Aquimarina aquimarini]